MKDVRFVRTLHDSLLTSARDYPDKTFLVSSGKSYTYQEFAASARKLASALVARGMRRGDRVVTFMDNSWYCAVSIYGTLLAGGVFVSINPQTREDKLAYILSDSGARFLLTDARLSGVFLPAGSSSSSVSGILYSGNTLNIASDYHCKVEQIDDVLAVTPPVETAPPTIPVDLAALIYTSGSTGNPKGVMMTHQSMVFAHDSLIEYQRTSAEDRILCAIPLSFDYGLYQLLMTVRLGATLVLERSFTYIAQIFAAIEQNSVTVFPGVPTMFATLLAAHRRKPICFPSVTRVTNTAAALPADFIPALREIFPNALIYKMYGLTECKRAAYLEPEELDRKIQSVGKAIPGTEMFLLSPEGNAVGPGEVGILHVRGPHVMVGYWNKPELTERMLKPGPTPGERVLCAQDWFTTDEEGYFYFKGRSDEIIKTRGEKVSPVEVENVLHAIPGVREAAVVPIPDEILGQAIKAFIACEPESGLTEREIKRQCVAKLENFMVPKVVEFLSELPKTNTNKIKKSELAARSEQSQS